MSQSGNIFAVLLVLCCQYQSQLESKSAGESNGFVLAIHLVE